MTTTELNSAEQVKENFKRDFLDLLEKYNAFIFIAENPYYPVDIEVHFPEVERNEEQEHIETLDFRTLIR